MKIQNKYWLFSFLSAAIPVVAWWLLNLSKPIAQSLSFSGVFFFFGGLGLGFLVCNAYYAVLWTIRARRFWNTFVVNAPIDSVHTWSAGRDWKIWSAIQPIVDKVLEIRAKTLETAYVAENKIKDESPADMTGMLRRHDALLKGMAGIAASYDYFWHARNLAYEWGFEVWSSYQDYIDPLERAGKKKFRKEF